MNEEEREPRLCQCKNRTPGSIITVESVETMICADCGYRVENTHNEEELQPCPQCGGSLKENADFPGFYKCVSCVLDLNYEFQYWWCYKEILRLKAALQAKDAEIAELKAKNERLETQLACAADFANTWARESGVMECDNPYFGLYLRDLISRLWDKSSSRYIAELGRSEKLVQALDKIAFGSLEKNFHELTTNKPDREIALEALEAHRKPEEAGK